MIRGTAVRAVSLTPIASPGRWGSTWRRRAGCRPFDTYLGRVTKARILEAVREAKGEDSVQMIDHLKKQDMAREAERLLAGSGWLPEILRSLSEPGPQPLCPPTTSPLLNSRPVWSACMSPVTTILPVAMRWSG
ncbi:hypothetical protein PHAMO_470066 [Magnetospirillum molischianum DSM 120]|uniref:Uncharacterized protein n=1 Tax=Magnetospirillum molischianum DSM 120 TaxID=1150626 RepID=H8FWS7_MAGML|nr:hypothetical protein PHAMO_470066 [Magnetospirillum molischianum DSM 120]